MSVYDDALQNEWIHDKIENKFCVMYIYRT